MVINKTYGRVDEAREMLEVLLDNLWINGKKLSLEMEPEEILERLKNARTVDLDVENFVIGMAREIILDTLIGMMSRSELNLLKTFFSLDSPVLNMFGLPSTWARRFGFDAYGPILREVNRLVFAQGAQSNVWTKKVLPGKTRLWP